MSRAGQAVPFQLGSGSLLFGLGGERWGRSGRASLWLGAAAEREDWVVWGAIRSARDGAGAASGRAFESSPAARCGWNDRL